MKPDKKIRKWLCQYLKKEYEKGSRSFDLRTSCWLLEHFYKTPKLPFIDVKEKTRVNRQISACKDESALDESGRILDQNCFPAIPFGKKGNTKDHGCGWIAVYNARKSMGEKVTPGEVLQQVNQGARSGGRRGVNPFFVLKLVRKLGYQAEMVLDPDKRNEKGKEADSFIICYIYRNREYRLNGHFISGYWDKEEGMFRIFNGEKAGMQLVQDLKEPLSANTVFSIMIAMKKNCQ